MTTKEQALELIRCNPDEAAEILSEQSQYIRGLRSVPAELQYLNLMQKIRQHGTRKGDRTGTGQLEIFGPQLDLDLTEGFPLLTTKRVWWKGVVEELLWMLRGETNVKSLQEKGVHIWDDWADENGDLGPVYGAQWRHWRGIHSAEYIDRGIRPLSEVDMMGDPEPSHSCVLADFDQITNVIERIKTRPNDRRLVVSAWNVAEIEDMRLPPCHCLFQFCVQDGYLHCHMYQRSADYFLGVPFNIASYALLTHIVAHVTGLQPGRLIISFGSAHLYMNHLEAVDEQLSRTPRRLPGFTLKHCVHPHLHHRDPLPYGCIDDFESEDLLDALLDYNPHPAIKAPIAV